MTKVNYFQVSVAGQETPELLYGHSKKHIKEMCEKESLDWDEVEQKIFSELQKEFTEKELYEARVRSKEIWEKMNSEGKE